MKTKLFFKSFLNGIFKDNKLFVLLLLMFPTLLVNNKWFWGLGIGLLTAIALIVSSTIVVLIGKYIPDKIRVILYIALTTLVIVGLQFLLVKYAPKINTMLGIYVPFVLINSIILGGMEVCDNKKTMVMSMYESIKTAFKFVFALTLIGFVNKYVSIFIILAFIVAIQNKIRHITNNQPYRITDINNIYNDLYENKNEIKSAFITGVLVTVISALMYFADLGVRKFIIVKFQVSYLYLPIIVLLIVCIIRLAEIIIKKYKTRLYNSLGIYFPIMTLNNVVMLLLILNIQSYSLITGLKYMVLVSSFVTIVMMVVAGVRDRSKESGVPLSFKGLPVVLLTLGLIALAL